MISAAINPFLNRQGIPPKGIIMTVVLPGGCQLACPYCVVARRGERKTVSQVTSDRLAQLASALGRRGLLGAVSVIGDEPLQQHVWPAARAFIEQATAFNVPTALITNGFELSRYVAALGGLAGTRVIVSLDAVGDRHDAIRRKQGAFANIDRGLARAIQDPDLQARLSVATILMPGNIEDVRNVIVYAGSLGVPRVILSPLVVFAEDEPLRAHPKVLAKAWRYLGELNQVAIEAGVDLCVSDEFGVLDEWEQKLRLAGIEIKAPAKDVGLIRIDAAGRIYTLEDIRQGWYSGLTLPDHVDEIDLIAERIIAALTNEISTAA